MRPFTGGKSGVFHRQGGAAEVVEVHIKAHQRPATTFIHFNAVYV